MITTVRVCSESQNLVYDNRSSLVYMARQKKVMNEGYSDILSCLNCMAVCIMEQMSFGV